MQQINPTDKSHEWHSLYFQTYSAEGVAAVLIGTLEFFGYQKYDPFPGGLGTPPRLKTFVKNFVAPIQDGWVRVLGLADKKILPDVSKEMVILHAWLTDSDGGANSGIDVYSDGLHSTDLLPFLRPDKTADDLVVALQGISAIEVEPTDPAPMIVTLPADVEQLAKSGKINPEQANKMMSKITGQLFGKMDRNSGGEASAMQEQAKTLLSAGVNWNSPAGQKLRGLASVLTLPTNWRTPDFDTVREAYQVARRLQRTPSAQLMPDEQAAIKALPDAIEYQPIYMGKA